MAKKMERDVAGQVITALVNKGWEDMTVYSPNSALYKEILKKVEVNLQRMGQGMKPETFVIKRPTKLSDKDAGYSLDFTYPDNKRHPVLSRLTLLRGSETSLDVADIANLPRKADLDTPAVRRTDSQRSRTFLAGEKQHGPAI